ncbi:MAG TPA: sulfotransferase [Longimicrobium sp.]
MLSAWLRPYGPADPHAAPMPVVVGAPRSGTTLLRLMLDSHPDLAIPPETGFLSIARKFRGSGDGLRERFFREITAFPPQAPNWADFGIPADDFRDALQRIEPFTASAGFRAFYRLYAARHGKPRWGDKTPIYCLEIDLIRRVLPEARFVHLIRDGRDVALSLREQWFAPGRDMATLARYWARCVAGARKSGLGRPDYLEVCYEELVRDPGPVLARVCRFLELEWDPAMLSHHTRARARLAEQNGAIAPDGTPLITREQRLRQQESSLRAPDPARIGGWRTAMLPEERAEFERVGGKLLRELGYLDAEG